MVGDAAVQGANERLERRKERPWWMSGWKQHLQTKVKVEVDVGNERESA